LRELEEFTVQQFTHYGVTIRFALDEEIPLMYAQPDALRQVFLGLLFNAQEAMEQGGEIVVTSRWDKGEQGSLSPLCRISVQDTGVGMTTEEVTRLFEPFKSKKEQGVGMGLYLSKQIIEQHTGRIEVTSEKGEGTVVDVFLPWDERCRGMQKEEDG
jgi:two-component system, sporulation sensor kinase E